MKERSLYTNEPSDVDLDHAVRVKDVLPNPKKIVFRKERFVTLRLDDSTVSDLLRWVHLLGALFLQIGVKTRLKVHPGNG